MALNEIEGFLDNEHSYVEVKKLNRTGSLNVTSSDPGISEIRFDEEDKNQFYSIGHRQITFDA